MRVLIVGSGGREHALAWKIAQSPTVSKIYCAPGNGGTALIAENVAIKETDIPALLSLVKSQKIDLTVVGPEAPLMAGIVDQFQQAGQLIFGPTRAAAQLEGSKVFAKRFMNEHGIPTATHVICHSRQECERVVANKPFPYVIKVDGLAAGKGAFVIKDEIAKQSAFRSIWEVHQFGTAADMVVVEEFLPGEELSVLAITDGNDYVILPAAQDHKRVFDGDEGPNTGGMGAYAPAPLATPQLIDKVARRIIEPTLRGMQAAGTPYCGVLYCGLMVANGEPAVVEFNARFGDPETQAILPLITSDFAQLLFDTARGNLTKQSIRLSNQYAVCVVLTAGGYPGEYTKGHLITGLTTIGDGQSQVFHAGTLWRDGQFYTNGGRVLGATAWADSLGQAIENAYVLAEQISFTDRHFRRDIGQKGLRHFPKNP